jgi:hypothetical protein
VCVLHVNTCTVVPLLGLLFVDGWEMLKIVLMLTCLWTGWAACHLSADKPAKLLLIIPWYYCLGDVDPCLIIAWMLLLHGATLLLLHAGGTAWSTYRCYCCLLR